MNKLDYKNKKLKGIRLNILYSGVLIITSIFVLTFFIIIVNVVTVYVLSSKLRFLGIFFIIFQLVLGCIIVIALNVLMLKKYVDNNNILNIDSNKLFMSNLYLYVLLNWLNKEYLLPSSSSSNIYNDNISYKDILLNNSTLNIFKIYTDFSSIGINLNENEIYVLLLIIIILLIGLYIILYIYYKKNK